MAREAVAWMKTQSSEAFAELYLSRQERWMRSSRDGAQDGIETSEIFGAGVRILREGRVAFASAAGADLAAIKGLYSRALRQLPLCEPEALRVLPGPQEQVDQSALAETLWDEDIFSHSLERISDRMREGEAAARDGRGDVKILRFDYEVNRCATLVAGTSGLFSSQKATWARSNAAVAVEANDGVHVGEGSRASRRAAALDCAAAGREAGQRALSLLDARRAASGKCAVLFEPWVGAEFIAVLADWLSAREVQRGRSPLSGQIGRRVASPLVTVRDDPRRPGGFASSLFDDEGLATRDKALIEGGILGEYLHDAASASRAGHSSNGCAIRDSYAHRPVPGASNLHLAAGRASREALIADTPAGILVSEVLGMHMVDPVSGAFSVGVSGRAIERGAIVHAVKGAMISGHLLELMGRVDGVADDLAFYGRAGSPTFRVERLDVA